MQAVKTQIMPYQAADTMWQVPCCWTRRRSWPRCPHVSGGCVTWRHSSYLGTGVWSRGWRPPSLSGASRWSAPGQCGACGPWVQRGRAQSRHHLRESSETRATWSAWARVLRPGAGQHTCRVLHYHDRVDHANITTILRCSDTTSELRIHFRCFFYFMIVIFSLNKLTKKW